MNWEQAVDIFLIHAHVSKVTSQDRPEFVCFFWCEFKSIAQNVLLVFQGPTISPVYTTKTGNICVDYYAIVICVPKPKLYHAVRQLRKAGGSGVLVSPLTYIFDEETPRYRNLLAALKS
jgi:hypothetical protein